MNGIVEEAFSELHSVCPLMQTSLMKVTIFYASALLHNCFGVTDFDLSHEICVNSPQTA